MRLTETEIKKLANPVKDTLTGDDATTGLYLRRSPSGRKTWIYRTRKGGAGWRVEKLGIYPAVTLAQARQKALALGQTIIPQAMTFGALLDEWYQRRIEPRYRVTKNVDVYVRKGKQWLGSTKLTQLATHALVNKLKGYAKEAPVSANRCLSNWKLALDYGVQCGYLDNNPLARTSATVVGGTEKARDRVLDDDEIRWLWNDQHRHAPLLRFILLTGLRISEAQAARVEHLEGDTLHIPDNKSQRPHWVHLTPLAKSQMGDFNGHLFESTCATSVQHRLKNTAKRTWTPHDLRRTFRTRLAALGVVPHVAEKCLNHKLEGILAVYDQHDYREERVKATKLWADELRRITA